MSEFITIGETMISFAPKNPKGLRYGTDLTMSIAGAESNTAIGMQKLGHSTQFISRVGNDSFGEYLLRMIKAEGVGTDYVIKDAAHPTGIMFKELRKHQNTEVTYYRKDSAASRMSGADILKEAVENADLLHITGITPILSQSCQEMIWAAVEMAREAGTKISFDPNVRRKLWLENDYTELMKEIIGKCSYLLLGLDEAKLLYGSEDLAELSDKIFANCDMKSVAVKNGDKGAWVMDPSRKIFIPPVSCTCIDSVGAGDAFNAGFLSGVLKHKDLSVCGRMGAIAGACATETLGDFEGMPELNEMENILNQTEVLYR